LAHSFSLSLTAVDVLLEHCKLGRAPFPFEVPHIGTTHDQREQVRQAVFRDLEGRGILQGGQVDDDVQETLRAFTLPSLAITVAAQLKDNAQLFARGARTGEFAVVVHQDKNLLVFETVRPTNLVSAIVDLLPSMRAGSGQSMTVAKP